MSYKRISKDKNHSEIVNHLRAHGVWVYDAASFGGGVSDLFVFHPTAETAFLEIKDNQRHKQFKRPQIDFMAKCLAPVGFVKTNESALEFALNPRRLGLTREQKDVLAGLLIKDARKVFTVLEIEKILKRGE